MAVLRPVAVRRYCARGHALRDVYDARQASGGRSRAGDRAGPRSQKLHFRRNAKNRAGSTPPARRIVSSQLQSGSYASWSSGRPDLDAQPAAASMAMAADGVSKVAIFAISTSPQLLTQKSDMKSEHPISLLKAMSVQS